MSRVSLSPASSAASQSTSGGIHFHALGAAPAVLSTEVARHFQKKHQHILRDIDRLCSMLPPLFTASNFGRSDYADSTGRTLPAWLLTRDALSLLVMGFTGTAALRWKLRYIEAFRRMEDELRRMANLARQEQPALAGSAAQTAARLIWGLGPKQKRRLRAVARYRNLGLGVHSIARLLQTSGREVSSLLKAAQTLGWLTPHPVQADLPGVQ